MTRTLLVVFIFACTAAARADEFDTLRQKWADMLTGGAGLNRADPTTAAAITSVTNTANTYWNSLIKTSPRTALWSDAASTTDSSHISTNFSRLRALALAYATTGSSLQGNAALRADILAGLDWMQANRYNETKAIYDNWWDWEIGSPKLLVDTAVLMYADLSATQLANYMRAVEKFTPSATTQAAGGSTGTFTGANRMDKIYVVAIRGLLVKDAAKLRAARDAFSNLFLWVTSGDGFYVDGSFIQHTKHPYTGSYGAVLIGGIAPLLALLNGPNADSPDGSTWRVTDPNLANVFQWVYRGYEPSIYRGGMMAMLQGRAVSRSSTSEHGIGHGIMHSILRLSQLAPEPDRARLRSTLRGWAESDTSRSFVGTAPLPLIADIQQLLADSGVTPRAELLGNFVFASMDRVVHLRRGFGVGLSLSSTRIYTYESINTENLHGWYTGDGMMYLYNADLTQFSDSFWPTVNPRRLPGITVDAGQARANGSGQGTTPTYNWVGGASLGDFGVAGMQLDGWSNSLTAKKSWFMFDDEVVCLGAGITSTDNRPIETVVENRILNTAGSSVFTVDGAAKPATPGWSDTLSGVQWAHLAGRVAGGDIGYFFPTAPGTVKALREARTGAWADINGGGSATPISRNYLTVWFDHGTNPSNATYAYAVLPNRNAAQTADYAAQPHFVVLENSPAIQAVRETTLGITAANFWNDGRASAGGITVDRKAAVLVQERDGTIDFALSDPTQAYSGSITVELSAAAQTMVSKDEAITVAQLTPSIRLSVNVSTARGRSLRARFATGEVRARAALTNLSTRAFLGPRDEVMIAGFVVGGAGSKQLLVRAVGPGLSALGVPGVLANPRLAIVNAAGTTVAENDDWSAGGNSAELGAAFAAVGAFGLSPASRDAAVLVNVPAGAYSAVVRSADATGSGVVLIEVYDTSPAAEPRLVNLSSRIFSGTGAQTAIVGFTLTGDASRQVLIRAAGPALAAFNVPGLLPDPFLRLTNAQGTMMTQNDNWQTSSFSADVAAMSTQVGAFPFGAGSRDSAALVALSPGNYTALVTDAGPGTGNVLVELYAAP